MDLPRFPGFGFDWIDPGLVADVLSVTQAFCCQLALGGGALALWFEWRARRRDRVVLRDFLRRTYAAVVAAAFLIGGLSGLGLWLTSDLMEPRADLLLLRELHWPAAIAWCFLALATVAGAAYLRHSALLRYRARMMLLVLYTGSFAVAFALATAMRCASLPSVAGKLSLASPTLAPTLVSVILLSPAIAASIACALTHGLPRWDTEESAEVVASSARFLVPLLLLPGSLVWFARAVPGFSGVLMTSGLFTIALAAATALVAVGVYALRRRPLPGRILSGLTVILLLTCIASAELAREDAQKPFAIYGILYANGVATDEVAELREHGIESLPTWRCPSATCLEDDGDAGQRGRHVFRRICSPCHTLHGQRGVLRETRGWDRGMLLYNLNRLDRLGPLMPPFAGNHADLDDLVEYILRARGEDR